MSAGNGTGKRNGLSGKQLRFLNAYLADPNATSAARAAGYSTKTAYSQGQRLLKHVEVAARIREAQTRQAEEAGVTAADVVAGLLHEARLTGEGSSHAARVAAWTAIAKHFGMFSEKREHSGQVTVRVIREEVSVGGD